MDEIINAAWQSLLRHAAADRNARSYTWWAKLNAEPDKTMMMINETLFRAAMREALVDPAFADWQRFVERLDEKAAVAVRLDGVMLTLDTEERTADW